jgi:hypothetical protein
VLSEYLILFWFAMLLNEYHEIEFMFRKIRNIRNLGNVYIRNLGNVYIVMSRTDTQNGLDFHFKVYIYSEIYSIQAVKLYTFSLFVCVAMCQGDEFSYI